MLCELLTNSPHLKFVDVAMSLYNIIYIQNGLRGKKSCIDPAFSLRQLMEKAIEKGTASFVAFIDLEKAFDRLNRVKLWKPLTQAQVGEVFVRIVQSLYMECKPRVKEGVE